jgi:hypothetical protein
MKKTHSLLLAFTVGSAYLAHAEFNPVAIDPSSYNQDVVVEKTAPAPVIPGGYTTASMDGGTNNNGDTWNEVGYFIDNPTVGIPAAGSTLVSAASADHSYLMAPSYTEANTIMLDAGNVFSSATFTLKTPTAYGALSFLTSGGNGGCIFRYTVHHQDGTTETGTSPSADWFNGADPAYIANGRVNAQTFTLDNLNSNNPRLYSKDVTLTNVSSPITSIDLAYVSSASGAHTCIMAVSGAASSTGTYTPIQVTGYNADIVVEASATHQQPLTSYVTATMDTGTLLTLFAWYEQGYDAQAPETGLPSAGSTLTNASAGDHKYILPSTYNGNNAVMIDPSTPSGTIVLATPTAFSGLSLLGASANGSLTAAYDVTFSDSSVESGTIVIPDWFNNTPVAYNANGRVNVETAVLDNVNNNNPRIYSVDFALANTTTPVSSITLTWTTGGTDTRAVIFALSGSSGAVAPVIDLQPVSAKVNPGDTATLTIHAGGTPPIDYQWQAGTNGNFVDVTEGGNVSGSGTESLAISAITPAQGADYRVIVSNSGGSSTSTVATVTVLSQLPPITAPSDSITSVGGTSPAAENVPHAIDQLTSKYLNFGATGSAPFQGPAGFIVTPSQGRTILSAIRFYTANDAPERDPADYKIEGSNDGGSSYSLIASGTLSLPDDRNAGGLVLDPLTQQIQQITLTNTTAYATYRVTFSNVKNNATATAMQIGEVEMLGQADTSGAPFISTQPLSVSAFEGSPVQLSAAASGSPAPSLQWLKRVNGTLTPVSDNGNITGSQTESLTINSASPSDAGEYVLSATSSTGNATSAPATVTVLSTLQDVTAPGDPITSIGDESAAYWTTSADPANAIDDTTIKYVNGGSGFSASAGFPPFNGPVGVEVTPSVGSTIVRGLRIYTADANPERDPVDYTLEGSNDGANYTLISSGALQLPQTRTAPGAFIDPLTQGVQEILFSNSAAYTSYRVTFSTVRNPDTANSMQIAELELLGGAGESGPVLGIAESAAGEITITSAQTGTLQSTTALGGQWTDEGAINGSRTLPATETHKFFRVLVTP